MKNLILTLLFFCFTSSLGAQDIASIFISYSSNNIILRIDDLDVIPLRDKPNAFILDLSVGKHKIEAWMANFEIQEYEVEISSAKINTLTIAMNDLNSGFQDYLKARRKYRINKLKNLTINSTAVGITSLLVLESIKTSSDDNEEKLRLEGNLAVAKKQYERAINDNELAIAASAHDSAINDLKNREIFSNRIKIITAGVGTLTVFRLIKEITKKKRKRPTYEDPNPFVFTNYQKDNKLNITLMSNGISFQF